MQNARGRDYTTRRRITRELRVISLDQIEIMVADLSRRLPIELVLDEIIDRLGYPWRITLSPPRNGQFMERSFRDMSGGRTHLYFVPRGTRTTRGIYSSGSRRYRGTLWVPLSSRGDRMQAVEWEENGHRVSSITRPRMSREQRRRRSSRSRNMRLSDYSERWNVYTLKP